MTTGRVPALSIVNHDHARLVAAEGDRQSVQIVHDLVADELRYHDMVGATITDPEARAEWDEAFAADRTKADETLSILADSLAGF